MRGSIVLYHRNGNANTLQEDDVCLSVPFLAQGGGRVSGLPNRVLKQLSSQG